VRRRRRRGDVQGDDGKPSRAGAPRDHRGVLHKNQQRWEDEDQSLEQLAKDDEGGHEEDELAVSDDFVQMFDQEGERE